MKKLFKLLILVALILGILKLLQDQMTKWQGMTEAQLREKLHTKLDDKMPAEQVDQIADKAAQAMRQKGMLAEEPAPSDAPVEDAPTEA